MCIRDRGRMELRGLLRQTLVLVPYVLCVAAKMVCYVLMVDALDYPLFLLWTTSVMTCFPYLPGSVLAKYRELQAERPGSSHTVWDLLRVRTPRGHLWFFGVGFNIAANGIMAQLADEHVGGALQSLLCQLVLPLTALIGYVWLNQRLRLVAWLGAGLVFAGTLLAALPPLLDDSSSGQSQVVWVLVYGLAMAPTALNVLMQERMYAAPYNASIPDAMLWSSLWSLLLGFVFIGLSGAWTSGGWEQVWSDQQDAAACFVGIRRDPTRCHAHAWLLPTLFSVFYLISNYQQASLISRESAVFNLMAQAISTPTTTLVFSWRGLVGSAAYTPIAWYTILSLAVITSGVVLNQTQSAHHEHDEKAELYDRVSEGTLEAFVEPPSGGATKDSLGNPEFSYASNSRGNE
eukprot:TRINITY_DN16384_c0_g1_i1.p1 TRINITY_DN16384_c0_g1~~TRINITY_DN16384_c0_g1_i1.p1  ORF type:complete len:404 (-),score=86.41 TRINITY_DN16384_c0_g1_i1:39-1250(-)